ncbi:hypothetical protein S7711_09294 [Stachybotrys chartarum IBT 7711]|uniref:Nephrocystin 3-like N-terminal domain-containing protein n=1 Tax=Stachybotrys chartarum (strain CBS 109288 / IBT 7711) TaxID=1280523 RepID=A0A084AJM5_STACB|nr:hypothetical protein S7711_09294 [Stachybotrys chartarum IBT 7711]
MASEIDHQLEAAATSGNISELARLMNASKESPPDHLIQKLLTAAAWKSQLPVIEMLVTRFPDVDLHEDTIRAAVYSGSIPLFSVLLNKEPSIVKRQFDHRGTPLIVACMAQKPIDFLRFLLEAGADPNQDPDTATYPLSIVAAFYTDTNSLDLLLDHGAKIQGSGALRAAAQFGKEDMIRRLLERGARPETDDRSRGNREHPLHCAVEHGHAGALRILLEHGADANLLDAQHRTVLAFAEQLERENGNRAECVELLRSCKTQQQIVGLIDNDEARGANPTIRVVEKFKNKDTRWTVNMTGFLRWQCDLFPIQKPKLLWVNAPFGFEKSMVCAYYVGQLSKSQQSGLPTASFFLRPEHWTPESFLEVLQSWLAQIIEHPMATKQVIKRARHVQGAHGIKPLLEKDVGDLCKYALSQMPGCTLILDGLDKWRVTNSPCRQENVTGFVHKLKTVVGSTTRVLIISRDEPLIHRELISQREWSAERLFVPLIDPQDSTT